MSRPFPPKQILYDKKWQLRPVEPKDIPAIEESVEASLPDLLPFMSWAHHPLNREKLLERVIQQQAHYFQGVDYELGMFDVTSGEFLLYIGFYPVSRINPLVFEIGYWTSSKHTQKGFATLATKILVALIFEYFKGDRIEITSNLKNLASTRVIEKCGFLHECNLRNFYPHPTAEMLNRGFTAERQAALYSLIPDDRSSLPWYTEIVELTTIEPLIGEVYPLPRYL